MKIALFELRRVGVLNTARYMLIRLLSSSDSRELGARLFTLRGVCSTDFF